MAHYSRLAVYQRMLDLGLVPVFYHPEPATAKKIVRACFDGGCTIVEFTNRGDLAYQVFAELIQWTRRELPEMVVGVGSVVDPGTAAIYIASGADFVVGPVLNPDIAKAANRRKIPYLPGCGTASEISRAEELGSEIIKIFPGSQLGGPGFVKSILAPCPWTLIMPTGGVSPEEENLKAWFEAGIACAGMGSKLIRKDLVEAGDFKGIQRLVAGTLSTIKRFNRRSR
jgi:2-dehydro-3-deoxyphosphogluconate aldolase/(4S)-4-hydroxy-2-oxoglutarate aldolase